jgi:hypothetical protein
VLEFGQLPEGNEGTEQDEEYPLKKGVFVDVVSERREEEESTVERESHHQATISKWEGPEGTDFGTNKCEIEKENS